jgi:2-amino-4-hydroxy-6-hydroxymethyldihydropteridine diphosphokinase
MMKAYIGLGSNLGNRQQYIYEAVESLHRHPAVTVVRCSSLYETAPVGMVDQPHFLNMVVAVHTELMPLALLDLLLHTEHALGRVRDIRFGPRTIDMDMLLFDNISLQDERLELPHPRMLERAFVLIPLIEIWEQDEVPNDLSILQAHERTDGKEDVRLWQKTSWHSELGRFAN